MEEQNSIPSRNNNEETTAEVFSNKFEIGKETGIGENWRERRSCSKSKKNEGDGICSGK